MASEPKKKHSKAQKRTRRAAIILREVALIACKNCGKKTISHQVCVECGFYAGKSVISPTKKVQVTKA